MSASTHGFCIFSAGDSIRLVPGSALSSRQFEQEMSSIGPAGIRGSERLMRRRNGQPDGAFPPRRQNNRGGMDMAEINSDEKVVVARSSINVANIIAAIALLILVIGLLRFIGVRIF
ncbi:MAG: hypothetical protein ABI810_14865 [Sphingomonas bacterium]